MRTGNAIGRLGYIGGLLVMVQFDLHHFHPGSSATVPECITPLIGSRLSLLVIVSL